MQRPRASLPELVDALATADENNRSALTLSILEFIESAIADRDVPSLTKENNFAQFLGNQLTAKEFFIVAQKLLQENMSHEVIFLLNNYKPKSILSDLHSGALIALIEDAEAKRQYDVIVALGEEAERVNLLNGVLGPFLASKLLVASRAMREARDLALVIANNDSFNRKLQSDKEELLGKKAGLEAEQEQLKKLLAAEELKAKTLQGLVTTAENDRVYNQAQAVAALNQAQSHIEQLQGNLSGVERDLLKTQKRIEATNNQIRNLEADNGRLQNEIRQKNQKITTIKRGIVVKSLFTTSGAVGGAILGFILFPPFGVLAGAAIGGLVGYGVGVLVNKLNNYFRKQSAIQIPEPPTRPAPPIPVAAVEPIARPTPAPTPASAPVAIGNAPQRVLSSSAPPAAPSIIVPDPAIENLSDRGDDHSSDDEQHKAVKKIVGSPEVVKGHSPLDDNSMFRHPELGDGAKKESKDDAKHEQKLADDLDNQVPAGIKAVKLRVGGDD